MGDFLVLLRFGTIAFMGWYASAVSTKRVIKEVGFHKKHYPEKYIMPSRRMRHLFKLRKREVPKWLYLEFYLSFVHMGLFILFTALYLCLDKKVLIIHAFSWIYGIFMCGDGIRLIIYLFLYR